MRPIVGSLQRPLRLRHCAATMPTTRHRPSPPAAVADPGAWHALSVDLNGLREWPRRIDTHSPGQSDSLNDHCRRELAVGQSLRVRATTQVHASRRLQLMIGAEEATSR